MLVTGMSHKSRLSSATAKRITLNTRRDLFTIGKQLIFTERYATIIYSIQVSQKLTRQLLLLDSQLKSRSPYCIVP